MRITHLVIDDNVFYCIYFFFSSSAPLPLGDGKKTFSCGVVWDVLLLFQARNTTLHTTHTFITLTQHTYILHFMMMAYVPLMLWIFFSFASK